MRAAAVIRHLVAAAVLLCSALPATAQVDGDNPFFDLARKPERVELPGQRIIRFLTDDDYPPFHFIGPDGQLSGFNIDLARAICQELKAACTIQARRWDTLVQALEENRGDAIIASLAAHHPARPRVDFGQPYYRTPARFASRKEKSGDPTPTALAEAEVAVVAGSSHAAFLAAFYPRLRLKTYPDQDEALRALGSGSVETFFGDGIGLAIWLNGQAGSACCAFRGGPFYESRYFGEGAAIAFRKDAVQLRRAVDFAVYRLAETGVYQNLMLKYFPVRFY